MSVSSAIPGIRKLCPDMTVKTKHAGDLIGYPPNIPQYPAADDFSNVARFRLAHFSQNAGFWRTISTASKGR
jgi:hypothetical protein